MEFKLHNYKYLTPLRVTRVIKGNFPTWNPANKLKSMASLFRNALMMFICILMFVVSAPQFSSVEEIQPGITSSKSTLSIPRDGMVVNTDKSNPLAFENSHNIPFTMNKHHVFAVPVFLKAAKLRMLLLSILIHYNYRHLLDHKDPIDRQAIGLPVLFSRVIQIIHDRTSWSTVQKRR